MKIFCFILFFSSFLVSCKQTQPLDSAKALRLNFHQSPQSFDPRKSGDIYTSTLAFMLFDGLTNSNHEGKIMLSLAESVEVLNEARTYIFHIRDAKWSDGKTITAYDFEYSWKKVLSPNFPSLSAYLFFPIKNAKEVKEGLLPVDKLGISSLDEKRFRVDLEKPTPYFLELISFASFYPVPENIDERAINWDKKLDSNTIVSGPFKGEKFRINRDIFLKKNELFWDSDQVNIEAISISLIADENLALNLFEKNELDWIGGTLSPIPTDAIAALLKSPYSVTIQKAATLFTTFNVTKAPFTNAHIRKAFSLAINRQELVEHISQLDDEVALSIIPSIMRDTQKKIAFFSDYCPDKAKIHLKKGLAELGIDKHELSAIQYLIPNIKIHQKIAQVLQEQWYLNLGIWVQINEVDNKILLDAFSKKEYFFGQYYWVAHYNDPMNILERFFKKSWGKNYPGWENSQYKKIVNESLFITEKEKRHQILENAEKILLKEMPLCPLFHMNSLFLKSHRIQNEGVSPIRGIQPRWIKVKNID
ncbi:MAG: peptide ABC transporter substrate-binding protein [Simkaniaceae bacterium]